LILRDEYLDDYWSEEVYHAVAGFGNLPDTLNRYSCDEEYEDIEDKIEAMKTHNVYEIILDEQKNYSGEDGDEWPYDSDWDYICNYDIKPITADKPKDDQ